MATTCLTAVTHKQLNIHVDVTMFAKFALEICVFECTFESRVSHNYMDAKFVGYALNAFLAPITSRCFDLCESGNTRTNRILTFSNLKSQPEGASQRLGVLDTAKAQVKMHYTVEALAILKDSTTFCEILMLLI